jgi:hypothetical protein
MHLRLSLLALAVCSCGALVTALADASVGRDERGNIHVSASEGRTVFLNGVDVLARASAHEAALATTQAAFSASVSALMSTLTALNATQASTQAALVSTQTALASRQAALSATMSRVQALEAKVVQRKEERRKGGG